MGYKRISLRHSDRHKVAETHDRIYEDLDLLLSKYIGLGKETHENALDTKFFVDEVADNFLLYDKQFQSVDIDIKINSSTLEVELKIKHDGNDFDPLAEDSNCPKIKAATSRLKIKNQVRTVGEEEHLRLKIKFNLKNEE